MIVIAGNGVFGESLHNLWLPNAALWARGESAAHYAHAKAVVLAVPARAVEEVALLFHAHLPIQTPFVIAAKGLSQEGRFLSDVTRELCPKRPILFLAGGTFAKDIKDGKPVAATLASDNQAALDAMHPMLSRPSLVLEMSNDIHAVELSAIMKNIAAIGTGATMGLELDESARAATFTRLFHEFVLCLEHFSDRDTPLSPWLFALLGDWILTCSSPSSRNYNKGLNLAFNQDDAALSEGSKSAKGVKKMILDSGVDAPVFLSVIDMIMQKITPEQWGKRLPELWKKSAFDAVMKQHHVA